MSSRSRKCLQRRPGLVNLQAGTGAFFGGIAGPYQALVYNKWNNPNRLTAGRLADPFPFVRRLVANQIGYGHIIATAMQTGNFQPVSAIPCDIAHNVTNVIGTLSNTSVTSSLVVQELQPTPSLMLGNAVGLPLVFGASLLGPPAAAIEAAGCGAMAFSAVVRPGTPPRRSPFSSTRPQSSPTASSTARRHTSGPDSELKIVQ